MTVLYILIAIIVGFAAGALVYRKHTKEAERIVQQLKGVNEKLQAKVDKLRK
ncbi:hypothetical protein AB7W40_09235 [Providencia rettgeri]|uniref:Uncharacterized protein n=1 Tax=Providencia rettgeri TaxID=587 RepID=A0A379FLT8_PRORE|nr:hypothetical protein [Providencia rettgeri]QXB04732.1 hypothetical protein I6L80_15250 [Providencia rettgeri]QXB06570.1 hypothetical protein I6L80_04715 [Providencia rettgeri]SUC29656.1 Uncharacterised protein [Providencia rettgeri]SUC32019.1 Uncharacterised protein [Providencia rettgeri]